MIYPEYYPILPGQTPEPTSQETHAEQNDETIAARIFSAEELKEYLELLNDYGHFLGPQGLLLGRAGFMNEPIEKLEEYQRRVDAEKKTPAVESQELVQPKTMNVEIDGKLRSLTKRDEVSLSGSDIFRLKDQNKDIHFLLKVNKAGRESWILAKSAAQMFSEDGKPKEMGFFLAEIPVQEEQDSIKIADSDFSEERYVFATIFGFLAFRNQYTLDGLDAVERPRMEIYQPDEFTSDLKNAEVTELYY